MHLEGFTVELLVDGIPLEEYSEPIQEQATRADSSYIRDADTHEPRISDKIVYAAVRDPNADFKVRFSGSTHNNNNGLLSANVHIDGEYDWTYTALARSSSNNSTTKSVSQGSFENEEEGIKKQKFKFGTKQWTGKNGALEVGSFGVVSVIFYKARRVVEEGEPLAILHLHYRSVEWLKMKGYDIPEKTNEEEHMMIEEETQENQDNIQQRQLPEKQSATFSILDIATYGWSRLKSMTRTIF
ncbi:13596_t:CDS:2 [Ambispora leptoticha]|uniref:13596_t:CDS:1 n=1 Tax=Ambispora leptoticha TaxID=144679 RepID=A0A9N8YYP8_9GLOM|nr:13596_t:CDS:2 [Ambispora leptoticha]